MSLKAKPITIDPNNPFAVDVFNRKNEIENLNSLVVNLDSPSVLAINSRWGTGKTTFIQRWQHYAKLNGQTTLYFNAWEMDFSEDPLVSFLGEMNEGLKLLIGCSSTSEIAWTRTKAVGKQILKRGIPALVKIGTLGIVDAEEIVEEQIADTLSALAGDALENYLLQKKAINDFKESLGNFINSTNGTNSIVIFVDELDRCRPTYAIALLERIKHLFSIDGLVFVLALDKIQLGHSIGAVYGAGIDTDGYLRRFIDFEYQLKRPELNAYIQSMYSTFKLDSYFLERSKYSELRYDGDHLVNSFCMIANGINLGLREVEQLFASINLAVRTAKVNEYIHPSLLVFLVVIKNIKPEIYCRYVSDFHNELESIEYLYTIVPVKNRGENIECAVLEGLLISAKGHRVNTAESEALLRHIKVVEDKAIRSDRTYSETVINVVRRPTGNGYGVNLKALTERIEFLTRFKFSNSEIIEN